MKKLNKVLVGALVMMAAALVVPLAHGQDNLVTLRSLDEKFEATGELVSADQEFYVLRTIIGEMNVPRNEVACIGAACPAQSTEVTLNAADGSSFSGELLGYDGTNYILKTSIGVLTIRSEFVQCQGAGCPAETQAAAVDTRVVLRSGDGSVFEGNLQEFDGTNYILETSVGVLTIRSEFVRCEGAACPDTGPVAARFTISAPPAQGEAFIGEALARFVAEKSLNLTRSIGGDGNTQYLIGDNSGALIADISVVATTDSAAMQALFANEAAFVLSRQAQPVASVATLTGVAPEDVARVLAARPIALDALVAQINPQNRVNSISIAEMADILAGRIDNWAQVGGEDAPINVYVLPPENNLMDLIHHRLMDPLGLRFGGNVSVLDSPKALAGAVAADANGFAVSYRSSAEGTKVPSTRNTCNMFSSPNSFSLQTGEYPLTMTWNLYTLNTREMSDMAVALADYLVSDQGQAAARVAGLVDLAIDQQPMSAQGERLLSAMLAENIGGQGINAYRAYLAEVSTATRLSTTLRFLTGSSELDERGLADIRRISNLISSGALEGNKLMVIGFSDSVGSFGANVNLSRNRAGVVKALLLQDNIGRLQSDDVLAFGFGPVAPVGCNSSAAGKSLNRRVEVWIRGANQQRLR